jgi:hypothetical protein
VEELAPIGSFIHALNALLPVNEKCDPKKVVGIIVDIVRGEGVAEGKEIPNRLLLRSDALIAVQPKHDMLKQW